MAYIYARTKSGKGFKMGVEDKHIYYNLTPEYIYLNKSVAPANTELNINNKYCITTNKLNQYDISSNFVIAQGTDENQRIGNKVFLKFVHLTYSITLNGDIYINNLSHSQAIDTYFRFRVMVVQFNESMSSTDIRDWFKATYTYMRTQAIHSGTVPVQSVHTAKLRESTTYTGNFNILYDKKTCLKKNKTVKMSTISIPIKQNINFENSTNKPTDESMKHIYLIIIGPCCNELDMDTISNDKTTSFSTGDLPTFTTQGVFKYEYYDL